jgi:polysaccharide pyruvyl transferase WcaK-like protein
MYHADKKLFHRCNLLDTFGGRSLKLAMRIYPVFNAVLLAGGTLIHGYNKVWLKGFMSCQEVCPSSFVFGTGVADPSFWRARPNYIDLLTEWVLTLRKCRFIGVRGPLSARILANAGLENVEIVGDLVLALADDVNTGSYHSGTIGFNVGHSYSDVWGKEEEIFTQFTILARLARQAGWRVKWFVVWPDDLDVTKHIAKASGTTAEIHEIYADYKAFLNLVRPLAIFVGLKLHSVALTTCAYVPSVMLEYDPKCRDYMQSINQDEAIIRTDRFVADEVWEIVKTFESRRQEISSRLYSSIKLVRDRQRQMAETLIAEMKDS